MIRHKKAKRKKQSEMTWDKKLHGFGVRKRKESVDAYCMLYRRCFSQKTKRITIGNSHDISYEAARLMAKTISDLLALESKGLHAKRQLNKLEAGFITNQSV